MSELNERNTGGVTYGPTDHDIEHRRCEELGEGACVPVVCSCGERWPGAPEFRDAVVYATVTWKDGRTTSAYLDEANFLVASNLEVRQWAGIIDVKVGGVGA